MVTAQSGINATLESRGWVRRAGFVSESVMDSMRLRPQSSSGTVHIVIQSQANVQMSTPVYVDKGFVIHRKGLTGHIVAMGKTRSYNLEGG